MLTSSKTQLPLHISLSLSPSLSLERREEKRRLKQEALIIRVLQIKVKVNSCLLESISMVPSTTSARHNKSLLGVSPPHPHHYHHHQQQQQQQRHLLEAISLLLSRWNGLQMAIQNQWGGQDSLQKSHQLETDIFSWFSQPKALLCVEDLENLLHECMLFSFNTEIEDGSIEEVAEQLMVMHEEYMHIIQ